MLKLLGILVLLGCVGCADPVDKDGLTKIQQQAEQDANERLRVQHDVYDRCITVGGVPIMSSKPYSRWQDQFVVQRCEFREK
jgi:hypothetical protein